MEKSKDELSASQKEVLDQICDENILRDMEGEEQCQK